MIVPGLHSVTFRKLTVEEIAPLAAGAGLSVVEWNGDVHVPPGDIEAAVAAARVTVDCGLAVSGYGSYHRTGDDPVSDFDAILATAVALGAPSIRVWAGRRGSADADASDRHRVADGLASIASTAAREGVQVALEFHAGTLTDTPRSTLDLLDAVGPAGVRTHWQPPVDVADADALDGLGTVAGYLASVHVFSWWPGQQRQPLDARSPLWMAALRQVAALPGDHAALLEFVAGDDPAAMQRDAATLLEWTAECR